MKETRPLTNGFIVQRLFRLLIATAYFSIPLHALDVDHDHDHGTEDTNEKRKPAPIPKYKPATKPGITGEFLVGVVTIKFKETEAPADLNEAFEKINRVSVNPQYAESGNERVTGSRSSSVDLEEYFKVYSNDIAWPKLVAMRDGSTVYEDPHFYGYYCEFDYWNNPIGWKDREEGKKRVKEMNEKAMKFAKKAYRGDQPRFICYNYITKRPAKPDEEVNEALYDFYIHRNADPDRTEPVKSNKDSNRDLSIDPWKYYRPVCRWGEPMWPNSKIQVNNFAGSVLAHEIGHCLGAPDVYRVGRRNDGISGEASLLAYGPTANAFSRFYHHAYIGQKNHPGITKSGTYTLHARHITPEGDEALGYLIPSNHPHYMYHVEYIHNEDGIAGVGPKHEGMLISVVNLGLTNYLGSPDYFYVYRPNDPFFRGKGDTSECLFGKAHKRTEFNMSTEPPSRLPNLMDGGVYFKNIEEKGETLTFEVEIGRNRIIGKEYTNSMLPQIRLDEIRDVQPTSFAMDCTIKFRGEPLITTYGFCWSTSQSPTVRNSTYTLAHRECYRGHAIGLKPNTTYHVRAFATNGVGIRYSDEELTVKTPDFDTASSSIEPLCTDYYSNNRYLFNKYRVVSQSAEKDPVDYSPTCVLAQLIAYYRPEKYVANALPGKDKAGNINFDLLSWNPSDEDFPMRLQEVDRFFTHIYRKGSQLGFHGFEPDKDIIKHIEDMTGFRSKPVLSTLNTESMDEVTQLIREDLTQSRPALIFFSNKVSPVRWAIIDGIDKEGKLHVDFPRKSSFTIDGRSTSKSPGYYSIDSLNFDRYETYVITSCYGRDR